MNEKNIEAELISLQRQVEALQKSAAEFVPRDVYDANRQTLEAHFDSIRSDIDIKTSNLRDKQDVLSASIEALSNKFEEYKREERRKEHRDREIRTRQYWSTVFAIAQGGLAIILWLVERLIIGGGFG